MNKNISIPLKPAQEELEKYVESIAYAVKVMIEMYEMSREIRKTSKPNDWLREADRDVIDQIATVENLDEETTNFLHTQLGTVEDEDTTTLKAALLLLKDNHEILEKLDEVLKKCNAQDVK